MSALRIAHVISTPEGLGGAERVVRALVQGGLDRGHEVRLMNPFAHRLSPEHSVGQDLPDGVYEAKACPHLWDVPALRSWLSDRLLKFGPHVVHAHLFHAQVAVASIGSRGEVRVLTHHHGSLVDEAGKLYERKLDRAAGKRFDRIVAVSDAVRDFLILEYGYPPSKVQVIRNGWEGHSEGERVPSTRPTLVCVANFGPQKGHRTLVNAFETVARELPEAHLVLVGDGDLLPAVRDQVRAANLVHRVEFTGRVGNVWPYLHSADVFVLPSLYESLGVVILEAMAAGLPIVASKVGGVPELINDGVSGLLVSPGDAAALSRSLIALLRDDSRRERFGAAARSAAQEYKMDRMVESYASLYEEIVVSR